jgi:dTDP-4-dehydrorhamnose 3,5-epimerase
MKFTRLEIPDVILCEPEIFGDDRGYFTETFRQDKLDAFLGFKINFCQDNESKSSFGVLRGLHYQLAPHAQTKLVRVIRGSVLDIALDIRKGSPNFGQHVAIELNAKNKKQLLVPRGFAHGFVVLSKEATFAYKVDNYYAPDCDRGIAFNDDSLCIDWKINPDLLQLSQKDLKQPLFKDTDYFNYLNNLY